MRWYWRWTVPGVLAAFVSRESSGWFRNQGFPFSRWGWRDQRDLYLRNPGTGLIFPCPFPARWYGLTIPYISPIKPILLKYPSTAARWKKPLGKLKRKLKHCFIQKDRDQNGHKQQPPLSLNSCSHAASCPRYLTALFWTLAATLNSHFFLA